jgi:hypothetical protein
LWEEVLSMMNCECCGRLIWLLHLYGFPGRGCLPIFLSFFLSSFLPASLGV